jgi:hypothetical protein
MKRWMIVVAVVIASAGASAVARQTPQDEEQQRALRSRIESRFNVVPITDGIALTPKTRMPDVRLIEVSEAGVAINGVVVTGRELRERVGNDADAILRLSYLDAESRRTLFSPAVEPPQAPREAPVERSTSPEPRDYRRSRQSTGDRVRIFGDVHVGKDEVVEGAAIAVLGSVRIEGEVGREVVAVLGSVTLGPNAVVGGDVVSVGGHVRRDESARVGGSVTDVALDGINSPDIDWRWGHPLPFNGFGAVPRLIGSGFRLLLLLLLTGTALLLARSTVESAAQRLSDDGIKSTIVGIAAEILIPPMLIISAILLAISIIGIPVVFLMTPIVVLFLILLALVGFTAAALAVGQWMRRRIGFATRPGFADVVVGVVVLLLPLLVGRLIAVAGWPVSGLSLLLIVVGVAVEFLAWTAGFGAVITNAFSRWQARRAARLTVQAPPPATP